jgi:hypothetical protein
MWRWLVIALIPVAVAACAGDGDRGAQSRAASTAAPATRTPPPMTTPEGGGARPLVEEQLAIIDGTRMPEPYRDVLQSLARKCRETPVELADAVVTERARMRAERGIAITVLDFLRGINSVIPEDRTGVACRDVATELGRTIGRP